MAKLEKIEQRLENIELNIVWCKSGGQDYSDNQ